MKKRIKTFRSGVKCFTGYLLGSMLALLLPLSFSGCSGEGNGLEEVFPADDDASLLASQWENIRTRSSSAGIVILVTTADTVSFEVEKTSDIIVDWGDGNMEINNFSHIYTDNAPVHTVTFNAPAAALTELECSRQELIFLDVTRATALTELNCGFNRLTELDVSENLGLLNLDCSSNRLLNSGLDVSHNLQLNCLTCFGNKLTHLDISKNTKLDTLYCNNNELESINVKNNVSLKIFSISQNKLKTIDLSANEELINLGCNNNSLSILDLSGARNLRELHCDNNGMMELNISKNTNLRTLSCGWNQLDVLLLPACPDLYYLFLWGNPIVNFPQRLEILVNALPDRTNDSSGFLILGIKYEPIEPICHAKNWVVG